MLYVLDLKYQAYIFIIILYSVTSFPILKLTLNPFASLKFVFRWVYHLGNQTVDFVGILWFFGVQKYSTTTKASNWIIYLIILTHMIKIWNLLSHCDIAHILYSFGTISFPQKFSTHLLTLVSYSVFSAHLNTSLHILQRSACTHMAIGYKVSNFWVNSRDVFFL